jgi:ATP-dependent RNA helicase DeaD
VFPVAVREFDVYRECMLFADMPLPATLHTALATQGYTEATGVQEAVVKAATTKDLLVSSRTGSGKTVAFGLAMLPPMLDATTGKVNTPAGKPRALVIAPTRELAQQVARELTWLGREAKLRIVTTVGGVDPRSEGRQLFQGCHIVVGTPGRLCDHLSRGALDLSALETVVLDEADEMLDMGFREELEKLLDAAPAARRTLMFSATLPPETVSLAKRYTTDPERVTVASASTSHEDIEHIVHLIGGGDRDAAVVNILRQYEASSSLVFCNTRDGAAHLAHGLIERGFSAVAFSGELSQPERQRALQSVRDGRTRVLVCTDVAARGLDLPAVGLVIHADPPTDVPALMHRSGRTGRAGRKGVAVILVPFARMRTVERVFFAAKIKTRPTPLPTVEQIQKLDEARMLERLRTSLTELEPADIEGAPALLALATPEQIAALLLRRERGALPLPELIEERRRQEPLHRRDDPAKRGFGVRTAEDNAGNVDDDRSIHRGEFGGIEPVWFVVNVGRMQRADPKWLLPMLCRRGGVDKRDLGRMVILDSETRFEILPATAERFARAASRPDEKEPRVFIRRLDAGVDGVTVAPRRAGPPHRNGSPPAEGGFRGPRRLQRTGDRHH